MGMEAEEKELWRRYRDECDLEARDFLFVRYSPWARSVAAAVARRFRPGVLEWQDHLQNARIGLLEAMFRYDITRGIDFMSYAKPRVRGAVFNGMRVLGSGKDAAHRQSSTVDRLESWAAESDDPLTDFIDTILGLSVGYLLEEGTDVDPGSEHGGILLDALLELPTRQREVLINHYLRHISFQDIAKELQLTKGRISQIHKEALQGLRRVLNNRRYDRDSFF